MMYILDGFEKQWIWLILIIEHFIFALESVNSPTIVFFRYSIFGKWHNSGLDNRIDLSPIGCYLFAFKQRTKTIFVCFITNKTFFKRWYKTQASKNIIFSFNNFSKTYHKQLEYNLTIRNSGLIRNVRLVESSLNLFINRNNKTLVTSVDTFTL